MSSFDFGREEKCSWRDKRDCEEEMQTHTHEFEGSVMLAEEGEDRHNHRFAGVSGEAIRVPGSHVHEIKTRTDFFENHFHNIKSVTGPAIDVGNGKHVHFDRAQTSENDEHFHNLQFATLIEDPLLKG